MFQSPSLRGSGRFEIEARAAAEEQPRFNPLHCGAVVASMRSGASLTCAARGFNPLHCGAVVASHGGAMITTINGKFQSPSLRGSGRFGSIPRGHGMVPHWFQSPSLRGSGRFTLAAWRAEARAAVSIPFIAGQWSLQAGKVRVSIRSVTPFQSPSLRGSGRFHF